MSCMILTGNAVLTGDFFHFIILIMQKISGRILLALLFLLTQIAITQAQQKPDGRIDDLISQMTIEEKVGQMTQLTLDMVIKGQPYAPESPATIDPAKLEKAIGKYGVGSILNTASGLQLDRNQWHEIIKAIQDKAMEGRLKIPVLYGIDAIHGANYVKGATLYPQPISVGNTFNRELAKELAAITAYEIKAASMPWNFSPAMDVGRNPEWPRLWESFGEDVYVNAELASATVEGYQGTNPAAFDKVAACLKHFTGYGAAHSGKDRTPAYVPERQLREYYLPAFQQAIDAGALTLMINSGEINGVPVHVSRYLLQDILRDELGFEGLAVSDWEDINYLHTRHKVAPTVKDAVRMAVEAGVDMAMVPVDYNFSDNLVELVKEGTIPESRLDVSVRRILEVKMKLGLFEKAVFDPQDYPKFGGKEFTAKSKAAAAESIVLLKNDKNILPLPKTANVLVTGPTAATLRSLNGGWTYTWQGDKADEWGGQYNTITEALTKKLGQGQVQYVQGADFDKVTDMQNAVMAASAVDYIVLCVGESSYTEFMGSLYDLNLPAAQQELAYAMAKTGKPIILVLAEGRPRIMREIEPLASAVVGTFYPGMEGANALADILFGDSNPSGKLCFTYPRHSNSLITYDHKTTEMVLEGNVGKYYDPQYEFGHGMSYTDFKYSDLSIGKNMLTADNAVEISVKVTNTGKRAGKESVLLFINDMYASITPSVRRLRGFKKIELQPGESQTVKFSVSAEDVAFVGMDNKFITESGDFEVMIGDLKGKFVAKMEKP